MSEPNYLVSRIVDPEFKPDTYEKALFLYQRLAEITIEAYMADPELADTSIGEDGTVNIDPKVTLWVTWLHTNWEPEDA